MAKRKDRFVAATVTSLGLKILTDLAQDLEGIDTFAAGAVFKLERDAQIYELVPYKPKRKGAKR